MQFDFETLKIYQKEQLKRNYLLSMIVQTLLTFLPLKIVMPITVEAMVEARSSFFGFFFQLSKLYKTSVVIPSTTSIKKN